MRKAFTLIELLVVIAVIAILASIILVAVMRATDQAKVVRTQALIDDFRVGIERYVGNVHKYPFNADPQGDFNPDDCWRELAPLSQDLTAGVQPGAATYRNKRMLECLSLDRDQLADLGGGTVHVVDSWQKPFSMQWDYFNHKTMIWSAGPDLSYDMSDNQVLGGHSSLFATQAQAQAGSPPPITAALKATTVELDLSNQ